MFKDWKVASAISTILWVLLLWHVFAVEIINLEGEFWTITGAVTVALLILFYSCFIYAYIKNRKKVQQLRDQYIETLKPDKPLRFCPSDDELMKRYIEKPAVQEIVPETTVDELTIKEHSQENDELEQV